MSIEEQEEVGLICAPYVWDRPANLLNNTALLDVFVAHSFFCQTPLTPEEQRVQGAWLVTNPRHLPFGIWRGGDLVGLIILTDVVPGVDALMHFLFIDGKMKSKRTILIEFMGMAFHQLGFERLTMHAPDFKGGYLDFLRVKLGFRFEGEPMAAEHLEAQKLAPPGQRPHVWLARFGSRRERTHFHDGAWHDTLCVRILKPEYEAQFPDVTTQSGSADAIAPGGT